MEKVSDRLRDAILAYCLGLDEEDLRNLRHSIKNGDLEWFPEEFASRSEPVYLLQVCGATSPRQDWTTTT
jgi:hypothetical protein